jgi:putative membrane protein
MTSNATVLIVALIHIYILVLEMFLWTSPFGRKAFGTTEAFANDSKVLAANQGLYNGFLAAGLFWGVWLAMTSGDAGGDPVKIFFLLCVAVAGAYGAATVSPRILIIQTIPALVALAATIFM